MAASDASYSGFVSRVGRIWGGLVSLTTLGQGLSLLALGIAARGMDLADFGGVAVVAGFCRLVDGLINIRSGAVLTKFGADAMEEGDNARLLGLFKAGLALDMATAALAALIAFLGLWLFADLIGTPDSILGVAMAYPLVILVSAAGFHAAVLRLYGRFWMMAAGGAAAAGIRCATFAMLLMLGAEAHWYLIAWLVSDMIAQILPTLLACREIARRGGRLRAARARAAVARADGFWPMLWASNGVTSVRALSEEGDIVLVGWLLGPTAAAAFRIGKACAGPLVQLGAPIQQAAFPDLTRQWAKGARVAFRRDLLRYSALGAVLGGLAVAGAILLAPWVVLLASGAQNPDAALTLTLQVAAYGIYLAGMAFLPAVAAMKRMSAYLLIALAAFAVFAVAIPLALPLIGPAGAALASVAHNLVWFTLAALMINAGSRAS